MNWSLLLSQYNCMMNMICTTWGIPSVSSILILVLWISFSLLLEFFSFNPIAIWAFGIPDFSVSRIARSAQNTSGMTRKMLRPGWGCRWWPENWLHLHCSLLHLCSFFHCRSSANFNWFSIFIIIDPYHLFSCRWHLLYQILLNCLMAWMLSRAC